MMEYTEQELNKPVRLLPTECIEFMEAGGYVINRNADGIPSTYYAGWKDAFRSAGKQQ